MRFRGVKWLTAIFFTTGLILSGCGTDDGWDDEDLAMIIASLNARVKTWTHPEDLNDNISPDGQDAGFPRVAMDASGNAIIVWAQSDGSNNQIFKSEYRNGAWTHPDGLSDNISPDGQEAIRFDLVMDDNGNAIIAWQQSDGANAQVFISEYRGGAWTHPSGLSDNISPDGQDAFDNFDVAMDNNGNAIIAWEQNDGAKSQIFKSEYRGGAWTHPADLNAHISPDGQDAEIPQVAMDDNGNAIIVWLQNDGAVRQIFKSEYRSGAWDHPADLSDNISPDGQAAVYPQVGMDAAGNAIIAWQQSDGANGQIFKSEYRNGGWNHPADLNANISPDGQDADWPRMAMNASGEAIITWIQSDGANAQIFKSEYRNGAWIHPTDLNDNVSLDGQDAVYPEVALDADGNTIIVWSQGTHPIYPIYMSEYQNGAWTHPSDLNDHISPAGEPGMFAEVAFDGSGNAIITWPQSDGSNHQIFKSEYR